MPPRAGRSGSGEGRETGARGASLFLHRRRAVTDRWRCTGGIEVENSHLLQQRRRAKLLLHSPEEEGIPEFSSTYSRSTSPDLVS